MIEFMVIAVPRSGTTWAANWLTTEATLCVHDPLLRMKRERLDEIESSKLLGISDTSLYQFPEVLNAHPARKVILRRSLYEVNDSLEALGVLPLSVTDTTRALDRIQGLHAVWTDLFDPNKAQMLYGHLLQRPFDFERHYELTKMQIQPEFAAVPYNKAVVRELFAELYRD